MFAELRRYRVLLCCGCDISTDTEDTVAKSGCYQIGVFCIKYTVDSWIMLWLAGSPVMLNGRAFPEGRGGPSTRCRICTRFFSIVDLRVSKSIFFLV